jgi:hypothetical protein
MPVGFAVYQLPENSGLKAVPLIGKMGWRHIGTISGLTVKQEMKGLSGTLVQGICRNYKWKPVNFWRVSKLTFPCEEIRVRFSCIFFATNDPYQDSRDIIPIRGRRQGNYSQREEAARCHFFVLAQIQSYRCLQSRGSQRLLSHLTWAS